MSKPVDCQVFQDQLDSLAGGRLSSEGLEALHSHARSCPHCEALLKMREHLSLSSQADLEAAVPDEYVDGMWPRVQGAIAEMESSRFAATGRGSAWRWLAPALAAACLVLLAGSVFLFSELIKIRDQEQILAMQLAQQVSMLAEVRAQTSFAAPKEASVAQLGGPGTSKRLQRALAGRDSVTFGELRSLLAKLPPDSELLNAAGARTAVRRVSPWGAGAWRELAEKIRTDDGLQAREALHFIETMDLDPKTSIPTSRLVSLSRTLLRRGAFSEEQGRRS